MAVGDIDGTARGTAARYNDNKPPLELIPLEIIAYSFSGLQRSALQDDVLSALRGLGRFQTERDADGALADALSDLSPYWADAARVFDYGRRKYSEWNWARGQNWSVPLACAARHALAVLGGEELDTESGLPHVGHMLCNLVMLRAFVTSYPEGDDLPPHGLFADRRGTVVDSTPVPVADSCWINWKPSLSFGGSE